jgi:hypothetical protein
MAADGSLVRIIRITNWGTLQHYKTRSAPWVKSYRTDLMPETPEGAAYLPLSMAARGLLSDLKRLAVGEGNAMLCDPEWIAFKLRATEPLAPLLDELLARGLIEVAESAIGPAIKVASVVASKTASALSISGSSSTRETKALSRSSGYVGEGETAADAESKNGNGRKHAGAPEPLASIMDRSGFGTPPAA